MIKTMSDVRGLISDLLTEAGRTDKDEILTQVDAVLGEQDYTMRFDVGNGSEYRVWQVEEGSWSWGWFEEDEDVDEFCGFPSYRDAVRDIKRDVREYLSVPYSDEVRILRALDRQMSL